MQHLQLLPALESLLLPCVSPAVGWERWSFATSDSELAEAASGFHLLVRILWLGLCVWFLGKNPTTSYVAGKNYYNIM